METIQNIPWVNPGIKFDKPYVWVIGGGLIQDIVVREIQTRNYQVLVTDQNGLGQGAIRAEQFQMIDTYDVPSHLEFAKTLPAPPIGVLTFGADVGPTVSALCQYFKLPGAKLGSANACRSKSVSRSSLFTGLNQRHPAYWIIDAIQKLSTSDSAWNSHVADTRKSWEKNAKAQRIDPYPCVVKPTDNCGSRGITQITDPELFSYALDYAARNSKGSKYLIIEEKITGDEIATDWLIHEYDAEPEFVMGVQRYFFPDKFGVELGCTYPWIPGPELCNIAVRVARLFNVVGPLKIDFTIHPHYGPIVMELGTRQSGGLDQYVYPWVTNVHPAQRYLDYALNFDLGHRPINPRPGFGAHVTGNFKPGRIDGYHGIDDARRVPGVLDVFTRSLDEIVPLVDGGSRPIFVAARGESPEQAFAIACLGITKISPNYVT